ncbi:glycosyltransferase family 2 protein [Salinibacter pepae]|mgnify:FL=1|uniref:glycosyltransferase family 2 protein n=1 Tax=Salinibacter pepae TaxID=3040382 RepID=UPI0021E90AFE|nr:glycosyltransferase family A protein [Salinibacter pepae]
MSNEQPFFSVMIPVYNRAEMISDTLESVFDQEYDDYEVIVVDDGSTDGTVEVVKSYGDRVTLLQQENRGPGAARNTGLEEVKGTYIAFLDSDDRWFPWTLAVYDQVIHAHDHPAFLAGKPFLFSEPDELGSVSRESVGTESFSDYFASGDEWRWWGVSSFVVRGDELRKVGGFANRPINAEDADLALRLGEAPGFVDVRTPATFAYRQHQNNLMSSVAKNAKGGRHLVEQEMRGNYPGGERRALERYRILTRHIRPISLACLCAGRTDEAWGLYRNTAGWNWKLNRWRYLFGFPMYALRERVL